LSSVKHVVVVVVTVVTVVIVRVFAITKEKKFFLRRDSLKERPFE